jgi:hypothetical protein
MRVRRRLMARNAVWPDLVFAGDADPAVLTRAVQRGTLRRLARGIYTGDTAAEPEAVVHRHLRSIVEHEFPGAVIADRSVLDAGMANDGTLFVVHNRQRPVEFPGVVVYPRPGPGPVTGDMEYPEGLFISSLERALLDNLVPSRARVRRTLDRSELEAWIEHLLQQRKEDGLNELRDRAGAIAGEIDRRNEMVQLDRLVTAVLATNDDVEAVPPALVARMAGVPYDGHRLELFAGLVDFLDGMAPESIPALDIDVTQRRLLTFYEAYFSNFIEGTEFTLDEAAEIVFDAVVPGDRSADAHDILGTYEIVSNPEEMRRTPRNADELEALLRSRHAVLMGNHPDKSLGRYKTRDDRAGPTFFVAWELVPGTLRHGFNLGAGLTSPMARAIYMMFLTAEVHPFADGNGRIARVMMNAELETAGEVPIVIPTVYRGSYLSALRGATHTGHFQALVAMITFARRWTARVDFSDRVHAENDLERTNAMRESAEAEDAGVRLVLP